MSAAVTGNDTARSDTTTKPRLRFIISPEREGRCEQSITSLQRPAQGLDQAALRLVFGSGYGYSLLSAVLWPAVCTMRTCSRFRSRAWRQPQECAIMSISLFMPVA